MTHVTVTGGQLDGDYVVRDQRDDGTIVLAPESTVRASLRAIDARLATTDEVDAVAEELGVLPPDGDH